MRKYFFKPAFSKVTAAMLLLYPVPHTTCSSSLVCKTAYFPIIISWVSTMPVSGITINPMGTTGYLGAILVLIGVALSYLISCVISAIYAKLSTKIRIRR